MKYRVSFTVDAQQLSGLVDAAYSVGDFDPAMTIERIDTPTVAIVDTLRRSPWSKKRAASMRGATIAEAAKRIKTPVKRGKVKFAEAVQRLQHPFPQVAEKLAAWKNKVGGLHGWDRMLKTQFPNAAQDLWPDWKPRQ